MKNSSSRTTTAATAAIMTAFDFGGVLGASCGGVAVAEFESGGVSPGARSVSIAGSAPGSGSALGLRSVSSRP
ncbi:hypothetical protein [Nesterenkonia pannonica]|uniref:hypothetical protein n=1 Tax=Nesterenkonia pannonica TaxID=1548602 RepID=UPI00216430FE|nr:hypothetical protein [Nesterenkonia pannonica]